MKETKKIDIKISDMLKKDQLSELPHNIDKLIADRIEEALKSDSEFVREKAKQIKEVPK